MVLLRKVLAWVPMAVLILLAAAGWWDWIVAQTWRLGVYEWEEGGRRRGLRVA